MTKLNIVQGNIMDVKFLNTHDIIVNPTNPRMLSGSGVCGAIFQAAGIDELESYTQNTYNISYNNEDNLMKVGEMRVTPGFKLGLDIMFAQGPRFYDYEPQEAVDLLLKTYRNIVKTAKEKGYKHILCPSLGTGIYGFTHSETASYVVSTLNSVLENKNIEFTLVIYDAKDLEYYSPKR